MIKSIEFSNFKSYKELTTIDFQELTLFSGLNSAGKSTIAQLLLILSQSMRFFTQRERITQPYLRLNTELLVMGKSEEVLFDKNKPLFIRLMMFDKSYITFSFSLATNTTDEEEVIESSYLKLIETEYRDYDTGKYYQASYNNEKWNISAQDILLIGDVEIEKLINKYIDTVIPKKLIQEGAKDNGVFPYSALVKFSEAENLNFYKFILKEFYVTKEDFINTLDERVKKHYSADGLNEFIKKEQKKNKSTIKLNKIILKTSDMDLSKILYTFNEIYQITYIYAFRGNPLRIYTDGAATKNPLLTVMKKGKMKIPYKYDFEKKEIKNIDLKSALNYWICDVFELCDKVSTKYLIDNLVSEIILKTNHKEIRINNVGFGVSQILPLTINCLVPNYNLLIIDEPESHLHPGLQTKVGKFLLHMAMIEKQLLVETHSEHIINILNYYSIKYPEIKSKIKSYWIYKKDDASVIENIEYDDYGFIKNPPKGFYDESENIVEKLSELRAKKMLDN